MKGRHTSPKNLDTEPMSSNQDTWLLGKHESEILPVHAALLRNGKVLYIAGSGHCPENKEFEARIWQPDPEQILPIKNVERDVWCGGHSFLADGRLFVCGGNKRYYPRPFNFLYAGIPAAYTFDPVTQEWKPERDMLDGRWYPTCTTLPSGEILVTAGYRENILWSFIPPLNIFLAIAFLFGYRGHIHTIFAPLHHNRQVEIYNGNSGEWRQIRKADRILPLYPRMHVVRTEEFSDGWGVFCSGPAQRTLLFNPYVPEWKGVGDSRFGNRYESTSVLLPLTPPDYHARILILGGSKSTFLDVGSTETAEIIDFGASSPSWNYTTEPMHHSRRHVNAVLLPNGKVFVVGGGKTGNEDPVLECELFDPTTETWTPTRSMTVARLYHSVALLLPDARVWVAGSNPHQCHDDLRIEIYKPSYLAHDDRPQIQSTSRDSLSYGSDMEIGVPDAQEIKSISLVRPSAVTHSFDMEQRLVYLEFRPRSSNALVAKMPSYSYIAPPGYYMLFVMDSNGVPSEARFIHLT